MAGAGVGSEQDYDALTAARFELSIDGDAMAVVLGAARHHDRGRRRRLHLESATETILKKLPGKRNPPTVTLKRGKTKNMEMAAWHEARRPRRRRRRPQVVLAHDVQHRGQAGGALPPDDAWPAKVEIGALKAGASEVLMETVTMTCEYIQRISV